MTKILVIEDEALVRETLLDLLELESFEVIVAENGQTGVQLAQEHIPDLILCDISMPELDGYGVLQCLRQHHQTAGIPLIFLTARATPTDFRQGMRLGADDYITKPFSQADLLDAIATRLAKHAAITQPYVQALEQATAELSNSLNFDPVTHLPTRLLLEERFNQICVLIGNTPAGNTSDPSPLLMNQSSRQRLLSVLVIGIDRIDYIRSFLHDSDDELLIQMIAQRLLRCVTEQDVVARLSEDQFAILLTDQNQQAIYSTCQSILESLSQVLYLNQQEIFLTASIGVAHYLQNGKTLNDLMRKASIVMHHVQSQGGNQYQVYRAEISGYSPGQLSLEANLRRALERQEFQVYYQPQVDIQTGCIIGAEALIRWQNPERGMVSPTEFIPLAEELGLIQPIGDWVLYTACQQTQAWRMAGFGLRIAINLSGRQFSQPNLKEKVAQTVLETQLDPTAIELELTESTLLQHKQEAIVTLNELKALGIQIAIDDFGTGYASLSYLKQFSFDTLKIDRCFIRNVHIESYNNAITTAVLQMAHRLHLKVVAEGVETNAELNFLYHHGCHAMQGYLFSRPVPASKFEALLLQNRCRMIDGALRSYSP